MATTPPSANPAPPTPPVPRRVKRRIAAVVLLVLLFVLGIGFWYSGREATLQQLMEKIVVASGGALTVSGVSGSLHGAMHAARIEHRTPEREIVAENVDIVWAPWQLVTGDIAITRLHAGMLTVTTKTKSDQPPPLPASLAPPFAVSIGSADVDRLVVAAPDSRTELGKVHAALDADRRSIRIRELSARSPFGSLAAIGSIDAQRPFALRGGLGLANGELHLNAGAALNGTLADLRIVADGQAEGASGNAKLALTPFERLPWRSIAVHVAGADPARFKPGLPQADLNLDLQAEVGKQGKLNGKLALANGMEAGPIDKKRLPFKSLTAALSGQAGAAQLSANLSDIVLDLGPAGRFAGSGRVNEGGRAELNLATSAIDMKHLVSSLHATRIAGQLALASAGKDGQSLSASLAEGLLRLELDAGMKDGQVAIRRARLSAGGGELNLSGTAGLEGRRPFALAGSLRHFNPARLGDYPAADLNANLKAAGSLAPAAQASLALAFEPSRLLGQPLAGNASLKLDARRLREVDAALQLGGNKLFAKGDFGAAGDKLQWNVDARNLAALQAGLQGAVQGSGVLTGSLQDPVSSFDVRASGLRLASGKSSRADGAIAAAGEVALKGDGPFRAKGEVQHLDPAAFGPYPSGNVNARFDAAGNLSVKHRQVALDLQFAPSTLGQAPLSGHARLNADPVRIGKADIDLRLGANSATAAGSLGAPGDRLQWRIDAPQLAALGPQFGGAMRGGGTLSGRMDAPGADFSLEGSGLRFAEQLRIATLKASGTWGENAAQGKGQALQARLELADAALPAMVVQALQLDASGTPAAHVLKLSARTAAPRNASSPLPPLDLQVEAAGGWRAGQGWQGSLRSLQNRGPLAFSLGHPAQLRVGPGQFSLQDAVLNLPGGSIEVALVEQNAAGWKSSGKAAGVPFTYLAQLSPRLAQSLGGNTDASLTLGANWNLVAQQTLAGSARVFRERGDITLRASVPGSGGPVTLGLDTLDARVDFANSTMQAQVAMAGSRAGRLRAAGSVRLARRDGRWVIPADSPLRLDVNADLASIAWLAPLTGQPSVELDGRVVLALAATGTVGSPLLSGEVSGDNLALRWVDEGVKLRNGQLRARLAGEQLTLQRLHFDGEEGSLDAAGSMRLAEAAPAMRVQVTADKLRALSRPDRILVVSGQSSLVLEAKKLKLDGRFQADRAEIELPRRGSLTISDDVVVVGTQKKAEKNGAAFPLEIDLELDLGQDFTLRGKGLDAQLAGNVRLRSQDRRAPRATGTIRVTQGTYAAYGQRLQIERGLITFTGALDNPTLNILAVRKRLALDNPDEGVEAGVEVRGTALAPSAKLVSTPNVPDSEKLSWLVLGHGSASAGNKEKDLLAAAAGALFGASGGTPLQTRIANKLGLDEVGMARAQGLETTVLTLGKRISSRAYLSYEQGVGGASSLVRLRYLLTKRFSIIAQTGTASAIDLFYFFSFE